MPTRYVWMLYTEANFMLLPCSGYMAPEYALYGQFSVKSDVFSFGILVLEIVSGQKNNHFLSGESVQDLLSFAWRDWIEGTATSIVDPSLINNGPRTEILRCIHIGLLCVQENAVNRPTMASVLLMLNSFSTSLPVPSQPALYMHSNVETGRSLLAMNEARGTGSDESSSTFYEGSTYEASITDLYPR
ncbi:hypothetical protein SAY86_030990 [Trapa natans]|uniref:Serine-threonine/tyrosine-protein kinase catalytic domain-containing protein n=1 Tax=Trapa natans TaxID=22666 RepID=A0AAN7RB48_TRANT|nr:hypothetical protein SAY86_030990 [Trapa natans]